MKQIKLVTVTRKDLKNGQILAQTIHSVSDFADQFPIQHKKWKTISNTVVSLSIDNEEKLERLYYKLLDNGANVVGFIEPDIGNQLTAICYYGTPEMIKITNKLNLALS